MRSFLVRPRSAPPSLPFHACVVIALVESFSPAFGNWPGQFHCTQSYGSRPRIHGDFLLVGFNGASREFLEERHHIRRNHRHVRRYVSFQTLVHECFDGFVFQRMVRLHHQTPSHRETVGDLGQCSRQFVKLTVDFDAQRLEHSFGRISCRTVRLRHNLIHKTVKLP